VTEGGLDGSPFLLVPAIHRKIWLNSRFLQGNFMPSWRCSRVLAALLLALALLTTAHAASPRPIRILLVYESGGFSPASMELQQGMLNHLRRELGEDVELFSEQMESTRLPETQCKVLSWIRERYTPHGIDVVIFVGSDSPAILPGVPTIYARFTSFATAADVSNTQSNAQVWFRIDLNRTIAAARRLQPEARSIVVISGTALEDELLLKEVREQLAKSDLPVSYRAGDSVEGLLQYVAHLPQNTIVLPISYTRAAQGNRYYSTRDVVHSLSRVSAAPIYAAADTTIGYGAVGGYVVDFDKSGELLAAIAVQMLHGHTAPSISLSPEATASYIFDSRQLKQWGLTERNLPAGSIVRFKTLGMWEQYCWRISAATTLLMVQLCLIIYLLFTQAKRKLAEDSLRDMTGRLLVAQDEERRRFARDLHDGTGQHLSAIALAIGQVLARFPSGHPALSRLLRDSHSASRQALDEVRTVSFALHPPLLDNLGLVAAVRWYLDGLQKRTNLRITFESPSEIMQLAPEAERALFRIVQESMNNVMRHSSGQTIVVTLAGRDNTVTLAIEDDGAGMSPQELAQAQGAAVTGVGVAGMRERLRQLAGTLRIDSNSRGTKVTATVPIDKERYAAAHSVGR
jgi:signal transduction histidine kinase